MGLWVFEVTLGFFMVTLMGIILGEICSRLYWIGRVLNFKLAMIYCQGNWMLDDD